MELLPSLTVTLTAGEKSRRLTAPELAKALGRDALVGELFALVLRPDFPQFVHEEGGVGVGEASSLPGNAERFSKAFFPSVSVPGREGVKGKGNPEPLAPASEALAWYLADKLGDQKSLAWYRLVARRLDRTTIDDALRRALDLEPRDTRRSRAALFTSIIRPQLIRSSYAAPPPAAPRAPGPRS